MRKRLLLASLILVSLSSFGIPAKKGMRTFQQPNGETIHVQVRGDEFSHYYETSDGLILKKSDDGYLKYAVIENGILKPGEYIAENPETRTAAAKVYLQTINQRDLSQSVNSKRAQTAAQRASIAKANAFPSTGEVHGLVLLVAFKDKAFSSSNPQTVFDNQMNGENYTANGATGSARQYFLDQSLNKFTPKFDVVGPITLSNNMSYYGGNDGNGDDLRPGQMVVDACTLANTQFGIDFSKYDLDSDGKVDLVYIIYAGYGEAQSGIDNNIWPHSWDINSQGLSLTLNNKKVNSYACSNELTGAAGNTIDGIGTFCHEFSHCLGLPDFYITSGNANNFGMGEWDLMDYGSYANDGITPVGYNAFERYSVGWLDLKELSTTQSVTLNPINTSNEAYVAYSDNNQNEYFIFENRQLSGWDTYLPYHGLLITHVDYLQSAWDNNSVNNTAGHQRFSIVPADNKLLIYDGNNGTAYLSSLKGDPYPGTSGNKAFTDTSSPAATLYTGGVLGKPVTAIQENGGVITFEFMKGVLKAPVAKTASNVTANSFTANWDASENASYYSLSVSEVVEGDVLIAEDFSKLNNYTESNPGTAAVDGSLDKYMQTSGWKGLKIFDAGGVCKIGSSTTKGYLTTPALDLSSSNGTITVYYTLRGKSNLASGATVSVGTDQALSTALSKKIMNITTTATRYCALFSGLPTSVYVKLYAGQVSYVDDIVIYSGDVSDSEPANQRSMKAAATTSLNFGPIYETSFEVTGLQPETKYSFKVKAHQDSETESDWSKSIALSTSSSTGIEQITLGDYLTINRNQLMVRNQAGKTLSIYQINGILVKSVQLESDMQTLTCDKGIYIVRLEDKTAKILIQE